MSDTPAIPDRFVRFPPGWGTVLVPPRPYRASAQATTLYTACRPVPLTAQRALWGLARIGGAHFLPGRREPFLPPIPRETFTELYRDWCRAAGGAVDGFAMHQRLQSSRPSAVVLLLCAGRRSLLLRVSRDLTRLEKEQRISQAAERMRPRTFRVPAVRATGERDGWHWTGYEVICRRPHAPARTASPAMLAEITELVESVLPRRADTPALWRGCHGDLTPWNLRRAGGTPWLIDWEDATWAPAGTDHVYFTATTMTLRSEPHGPLQFADAHAGAVTYWQGILRKREVVEREERLHRRLSILLGNDATHP